MNIIKSGNNELVFVDYGDLLEKILQILQNQPPQDLFKVSPDNQQLRVDIDAIASQVAKLQVNNPLGASANSAKAAAVNFSPGFKENFPSQIRGIAYCIKRLLNDAISQQYPTKTTREFIENLVIDWLSFKGDAVSLNFTYPFTTYQGLQKQRLTFPDKSAKGKELLKFHKLTISVQKTREFNEQLREGLEKYIKAQFASASEEEREDLGYLLEDLHKEKENYEFDFYRLKRILDKETLGKLKKQAQINYLEFLYENISTDSSITHAEAAIYLQDTIRRLKLIEEYINDVNKADGYYLVNYAGVSLNYRDIFSRAEAYEMLPIIPKIEGYLGETTDEQRGEIQFIFGLKLKFDGKVQAYGGKNVFEYYLNLLNPDSKEHQSELADHLKKETFARKVLKIIFLYYFLFAVNPNPKFSDLSYDPIPKFEQKVMQTLKSDNEDAKQQIFRDVIKYFQEFNIKEKINKLKIMLIKVINSERTFPTREYPHHICISKGILEQDIDNVLNQNTFFKPVLKGNPKENLKYISISQASVNKDSLCSLPAKITISDVHYLATEDKQSFSMEYDITGIRTLPLLFFPSGDETSQRVYNQYFRERKAVLVPFRLEDNKLESQEAFIYQFTFSLLTYICINELLNKQGKLFIPILRLHLHNKEEDTLVEKFVASFSHILSHLLNENNRSNAQGVYIKDLQSKQGQYKVPNVLSSLYSVLPKKFTVSNPSDSPTQVDKLAIIVVSSRESDRRWGSMQKLSNLMGEILVLSSKDNAVRVQLLKTFSDNYEHQQMFRQPNVVIDEVAKLYKKGYRHFVYIAKAPYTSTLHMTQTEDDDGLFFLSKEVLKAFKKENNDIKIYPIFFDKYYAVKLKEKTEVSSLYIQDTAELSHLVDDPSQKSVVFFNLFNGVVIDKKEHKYNGVISYATLLNIYKDKESSKLIQAAGYAHSFSEFLHKTGIINAETPLVVNAVGYSDRGLSAMSVRQDNLSILKTCYEIYKHDLSGKEINNARKQVLNRIKRSAYGSFTNGKDFIDKLLAIQPNTINSITHQEQVTNFFNSVGAVPQELMNQLGLTGTMNLRKAHAELIKKALKSEATYIFLTGNPGIGKTTAIVDFLREHIDEGFLFFYVSPRKQVNLDIIEKFKDKDSSQLCDDRILAINTHNDLITDNSGAYTVQYLCNQRQGDFSVQSVNFRDSRNIKPQQRRPNKLKQPAEDVIQENGKKNRGVLNSICEALSTIVDQKLFDNIVATVSIQSLKKTYTGDTLKHFEKIFRNAYNERVGVVISEEMKNISRKIKHFFIMIDEITGDDSGVEFLHGISEILLKYKLMLPEYGFNTKVIVADASIVDENVINQHLSDKSPEPDKIYFRKASDTCQPLSQKQFQFKNLLSTVINANSFPASGLSITYKLTLESCPYIEQTRLKRHNSLINSLQQEIFQDIETLLSRSDVEQIIVYIQNKKRLSELIDRIKNQRGEFHQFKDYLEIHANIPEQEKEEINKYKNDVKVVFMTASGSRGLSFPKARHILIEIPGFQIEKNLMEVIQVIYRGRGDNEIDNQAKHLFFYLSERSVYYQDDETHQHLSIQESVLSLLNVLLILKASIMTRIFGYGFIGRNQFMIIPIGGKSIFAVGETFSTQMVNLIYQLKQEYYRKRNNPLLENVYKNLEQLFGKAEFVVRDATKSSYLNLQQSFNSKFPLICQRLDNLLDFGNIELGYISGSLLVVPLKEHSLEETYYMRVLDIANYANAELWRNLQHISHSKSYPESLRSAIKDAIELVKKLRDGVDKTQKLEQSSQNSDQYYAFPLFAFISGDVMKDYFESDPEEPEEERFRNILATYIRSLYPVGNILPIGDKYRDFPFVVFRSYSLEEIRKKIFTDKYLLTSNELNVLNLILSKEAV